MTMKPETMGEAVDRQGVPEVLSLVIDLARALKRLPMGEWDYRFQTNGRWRLLGNAGKTPEWRADPDALAIPRFHVGFMFNGWPAALISPAGGTTAGISEEALIAALEAELSHVKAPKPTRE